MAAIVGYNGNLDFGGIIDSDVVYRTHAWSIDVAGDTHDITNFTSTGWREFLAGLKGWSGTIELHVDDTNQIVPSDVGSTATLTGYLNSTDKLFGQAIVNSWSPATTVDGIATQSVGFQGTSDLWFAGA